MTGGFCPYLLRCMAPVRLFRDPRVLEVLFLLLTASETGISSKEGGKTGVFSFKISTELLNYWDVWDVFSFKFSAGFFNYWGVFSSFSLIWAAR